MYSICTALYTHVIEIHKFSLLHCIVSEPSWIKILKSFLVAFQIRVRVPWITSKEWPLSITATIGRSWVCNKWPSCGHLPQTCSILLDIIQVRHELPHKTHVFICSIFYASWMPTCSESVDVRWDQLKGHLMYYVLLNLGQVCCFWCYLAHSGPLVVVLWSTCQVVE